MRSLSLADVQEAKSRLTGAIENTPCLHSRTLSRLTGCELHLKFENLQFTASFKERGALNKLLTLSPEERRRGVCAMSAGNHAQGVAYHAKRLEVPATIFMPRGTPFTKISRTRDHGAQVVIEGQNLTEALGAAKDWAASSHATFIHPYDDPLVIAGQGTLGLEMLAAIPGPDVVLVPIGGGGLIAGIATVVKAVSPATRVVGVQTRTYPSMVNAMKGVETPCPDGLTIAEGIAVKTAGLLTREVVAALVDDILLVDETSIERAVALLLDVEKTVVEGAGAAGIAAVLEHGAHFGGLRVVTPLCGGNIDLRMLSSIAMRELVRDQRLLRISVPINDRPGELSSLTAIVGSTGADIVELSHDRLGLALNARAAVVELVAEVQDAAHGAALLRALRQGGFSPCRSTAKRSH